MTSASPAPADALPDSRQLALPAVGILGIRKPGLAVPVTFRLAPEVLRPVGHRAILMATTFHGLEFLTAPGRVFTPRATTEALVDAALAHIDERPLRVADVGTGSGVIGVSIAVAAPNVEVYATDINADAVSLARENAERHGVGDRVHVFEGDLLDAGPGDRRPGGREPAVPAGRPSAGRSTTTSRRKAIYAPGDGLEPLRRMLNFCEAGKLAMPGFALVQYRRRRARGRLPAPAGAARAARRGTPPRRRLGHVDREVVFVDGVRTAFGRAGEKGIFWRTRADDMGVKVVRELLRRSPQLEPERIGDVILAATAQVGDQGLTLGRDVALLAGIPKSVPGFAVDRMCAGALTAVTAGAGRDRDGRLRRGRRRGASSTWVTTRWARTSTSTRASSPSDSWTRPR